MKKMLAMLLAAVTITSMAATALADTDVESKLSLGKDDGLTLQDALLTPGEKYSFPLMLTTDGKTEALTKDHMDGYNIRLENQDGKNAIDGAKVVEEGKKYFLELSTKGGWPTKQTDVSYRLRYMNKSSGKVVSSVEVSFAVGYATASDMYVDTMSQGDQINVDAKAPVFTKEQLEKLADLNNYKKVTFGGDDWTFETAINGMDSINMLYNSKAVEDIINKFPTYDFKFLTFPAGPIFKGNAELKIDVSDIENDFDGKFYVYRYLNGKLTKEGFSYDQEDSVLTLSTNQLGRFVISDKEIADGTVIFDSNGSDESSNGGESNENSSSSSSNGSSETTKPNPNPETGAGAMAVAPLALVMAASAAVVCFKKK